LSTERIDIYGGKATIKQNKFGVWQFRMWVSNEKRYYEKSLRTKRRLEAIDKAEEMYFDLQNELKDGRKLFSVSIAEAVAIYLEYRKIDVRTKEIVEGRWNTIRAHLNHFIEYVGEKEKAANLGINTLVKFERQSKETNYVLFRTEQGAAKQTVRNEMASINACQRHLCDIEQITSFPRFRLPSLKIEGSSTKSGEEVQRMTFTHDEWKSFYTSMRSYSAKVKNRLTDKEAFERELVRHWCLFAANSGLRSGEQRQLRWSDVSLHKENDNGDELLLVRVNIRKGTTKIRKERTFWCRGGDYLQRWKAIQKEYGESTEGLIFSLDGKEEYERYRLHRHWRQIMLLTDITLDKRELLVPYSLRHLAITNQVLSGVSLSDVAFYCGTSVKQIESTYYHLNEEKMRAVATARFVRRDGKIYALGKEIAED